jgi:hypothetical protein
MDLLTGKDYPHLCDGCQSMVDLCAVAVREGPDTDDEEAALMLAGDQGLLCDREMAGTRCAHSGK